MCRQSLRKRGRSGLKGDSGATRHWIHPLYVFVNTYWSISSPRLPSGQGKVFLGSLGKQEPLLVTRRGDTARGWLTPTCQVCMHHHHQSKSCNIFSVYAVSSVRPTLPQLLEIDLPVRINNRIESFGTFLLNDETGSKMVALREMFRGDQERIAMEVLREWLAGKGVEVTWESLIATLRKSKLHLMAEQIQMALNILVL